MKRQWIFTVLAATLALVVLLMMTGAIAAAPTEVFINELHYDNSGTDADESIEVAGPAGTDLTGWSLVLYNGSNGAMYNTTVLSGAIPDQQNGYGTGFVTYPVNGIQNGAPDGVALVDAANAVQQFLSYEGVLTAVDGPAAGMTSTDIGVAQGSGTPVGYSLQLTGSGTTYEDFAWAEAQPNTFGAVNTGQSFSNGGTAPAIQINETDADTPSTDTAEFIELIDLGAGNTDLSGLVVVLYNGSDDASYNAFDLDGQSTSADGYFVLCGNAANVANCDLDVSPDSNLIQNGGDAVALYEGNAEDFPNDTPVTTENLIDALVYDTDDGDDSGLLVLLNPGQPQVNENGKGDKDNHSNQRCPDGSGGARNTDTYDQWAPTPGAENICEIVIPPLSCTDGSTITFIHDVQGAGLTSPLEGQVVVIDGVVVGDFQNNAEEDNGNLNGFYVQEEVADQDNNPLTSEGVFVYAPGSEDVKNGERVRVRGEASEYVTSGGASSMTQVRHDALAVCEGPGDAPPSTAVTLPVAAVSDMERFEGMLTTFTQALNIAEFFNFDRFNETVLTVDRQFQPTAIYEPGSQAAADLADLNARSRITLDDGRTTQNPDPAIHQNGNVFDLTNLFRGGDTAQNATGVIDESFGIYRIQPTQGAIYQSLNPRPAAPDDVGGQLRVASLNVLNYFTTIDEDGNLCGPPGFEAGCRGADNQDELDRQRAKIIPALLGLDADVIGLMEIQNSGSDEAVADLVAGMNDEAGAGTYAYIPTGFVGTDVIIQAFIYRVASVSPEGDFAALDDASFIDPNNTGSPKNRPALAQSFSDDNSGEIFTVVVNHLKSKGSGCGVGDDDPEQGSCNLTRTLAVQELLEWLDTDPTSSGDSDFMIIGDLNAYDKEDPIDVLIDANYTDLAALFGGEKAYSYVFNGQLGYLDYALANESMMSYVTGATIWHTNADEPDILDYDTRFKKPAQQELWEPNEFRASDHDPVVVGLSFNQPPVCSGARPSFASLWSPNHKMVPIQVMGVTDPDGDPFTITIDSIFQDEPVNGDGDGNTAPDGEGVGTELAYVRAERDGGANGRVYHISFTATDDYGNSCSSTVMVGVPVSNAKRGGDAVDDGPLYDSTIVED